MKLSFLRLLGYFAAACLIEGWLAAGWALASCGDYVMVGGHGHHARHDARATATGATAARADGHQPPCHGPHCSGMPPSSPHRPATVSSGSQEWIVASGDQPRLCISQNGAVAPFDKVLDTYQVVSIFRPPPA